MKKCWSCGFIDCMQHLYLTIRWGYCSGLEFPFVIYNPSWEILMVLASYSFCHQRAASSSSATAPTCSQWPGQAEHGSWMNIVTQEHCFYLRTIPSLTFVMLPVWTWFKTELLRSVKSKKYEGTFWLESFFFSSVSLIWFLSQLVHGKCWRKCSGDAPWRRTLIWNMEMWDQIPAGAKES